MTNIYCGNNLVNQQLTNGQSILGTRYRCLQKGIGRGMHSVNAINYEGPYEPIDERKIYCGNQDVLPDGYDYMGNLPLCLQKGVGVGLHIKNNQLNGPLDGNESPDVDSTTSDGKYQSSQKTSSITQSKPTHIIKYISIIVFAIILFSFLYSTTPKFLLNKEKNIMWRQFMVFYIMILLVFIIIMLIT